MTTQIKIIRYSKKSKKHKEPQPTYKYLFKVSLLGDSSVGKTSIVLKLTDQTFSENLSSTIGVDFKIISFDLGNNLYAKMQIWDTSGSEKFNSLTGSFIKSCTIFILVFDLTKKITLANGEKWIKIINEQANPKLIYLVGNKSDGIRDVSDDDIKKFIDQFNIKYMETSAKLGKNIEELFIDILNCLINDDFKLNDSMIYHENNKENENENDNVTTTFCNLTTLSIENQKEEKKKCLC